MMRCTQCGRITGHCEEDEGVIMNNGDVLCIRCYEQYCKEHGIFDDTMFDESRRDEFLKAE